MSGADDDDSHIIASVRRILGEDAARTRPEPSGGGAPPSDDVFELSADMLIEPIVPHPEPQPAPVPGAGWGLDRSVSPHGEPPLDGVAGVDSSGIRAAPEPTPAPPPRRPPTVNG